MRIKVFWKRNYKRIIMWAALAVLLFIISMYSKQIMDVFNSENYTDLPPTNSREEKPRENTGAVVKNLGSGVYTAGEDIAQGRYTVSANGGYGHFIIYDETLAEINEVLGSINEYAGVPDITFTLMNGQKFEISGLPPVTFTPVQTEKKLTLTTGLWEVGIDIDPGTYKLTTSEKRGGVVTVYAGERPVVYQPIGINASGEGTEEATITIEENQLIRVSAIPSVIFTPAGS